MKNTLVIDLDRCSGCDSCVAACKHENQMNLGVVRNHVSAIGPTGTFPDIEMYWLPMQCQQCENPGCIEVCPTGASYRDEATGIVLVNAEDCIGCESCLKGCPYGVRHMDPKTNTIEKCTLCYQRRNDENWEPACVHNCNCGARFFGDLDEGLESFQALAPTHDLATSYEDMMQNRTTLGEWCEPFTEDDVYHLTDTGNGPKVCYILRNRTWQGEE